MLSTAAKRRLSHLVRDHLTHRSDSLANKAENIARIQQLAENGQIGIIYSSTDCDHVTERDSAILPANYASVKQWEQRFYDNAEGPSVFYLASPSEARGFKRSTRDRVMEAHEDGHAHVVYQ